MRATGQKAVVAGGFLGELSFSAIRRNRTGNRLEVGQVDVMPDPICGAERISPHKLSGGDNGRREINSGKS